MEIQGKSCDVIRTLKLGKKRSNEDLEMRIHTVMVNSMSDKVVSSIMHCSTSEEMLTKLDLLYGLKGDDLDDLQIQFQTYKYDNSISSLENVIKLEHLK